jgi:hypothetical protein
MFRAFYTGQAFDAYWAATPLSPPIMLIPHLSPVLLTTLSRQLAHSYTTYLLTIPVSAVWLCIPLLTIAIRTLEDFRRQRYFAVESIESQSNFNKSILPQSSRSTMSSARRQCEADIKCSHMKYESCRAVQLCFVLRMSGIQISSLTLVILLEMFRSSVVRWGTMLQAGR